LAVIHSNRACLSILGSMDRHCKCIHHVSICVFSCGGDGVSRWHRAIRCPWLNGLNVSIFSNR
jgi:hypothetical protein